MNKLVEQPALKWWVEDALQARQVQINAVKSEYWSRREKFGLPLPKSVKEAQNIDHDYFDPKSPRGPKPMLWHKAIEKEMNAVKVAFEFCGDNAQLVKRKSNVIWFLT